MALSSPIAFLQADFIGVVSLIVMVVGALVLAAFLFGMFVGKQVWKPPLKH